ncbi:hypothetical protein TNCV_786991 [Trichonephila clavipes]|nr:hypothetical protein TNCV_786991 [Trichonephila clavipes]
MYIVKEEMPGPVFGNRIVDLELIVEAFSQLCCPKCFAEKVELFEDSRYDCAPFYTKNVLENAPVINTRLEAKLLKVVQEVAEESMIKAATECLNKMWHIGGWQWQRRGYTSMNGCVAANFYK